MNMKWKLSALALASALSFSATAADVTLSVKGEITPGACTPVLSASEVDYGTVNAANLTAVAPALNQLGNKTVDLTINCTSAVPVGITANDARSDSRADLNATSFIDNAGSTGTRLSTGGNAYGLGKVNDVNIGAYSLAVDINKVSVTDDSNTAISADVISSYSTSNPSTATDWVKSSQGFMNPLSAAPWGTITSFARSGSVTPVAIKSATVPLIISTAIQDVNLLTSDAGEPVNLDGNATISLVYL